MLSQREGMEVGTDGKGRNYYCLRYQGDDIKKKKKKKRLKKSCYNLGLRKSGKGTVVYLSLWGSSCAAASGRGRLVLETE